VQQKPEEKRVMALTLTGLEFSTCLIQVSTRSLSSKYLSSLDQGSETQMYSNQQTNLTENVKTESSQERKLPCYLKTWSGGAYSKIKKVELRNLDLGRLKSTETECAQTPRQLRNVGCVHALQLDLTLPATRLAARIPS
jgi:hypothetical protein